MIGKTGLQGQTYLDPELMCALWIVTGSITKIVTRLTSEGIVNPTTGAIPSRMGVMNSAKRSEIYKNYVMKREQNKSMSAEPSLEEVQYCRSVIPELMRKQVELVRELREGRKDIYGIGLEPR